MKKILLLLTVVCSATFTACDAASELSSPNEEVGGNDNTVSFKVDMRVPELEDEVIKLENEISLAYVKFYTDLITSRLAVPKNYTLTFTKDGEVIGEYKGTWDETEIALSDGTYRVTGECMGNLNKASFSFDESITIDKNTSILTLSPRFNCWLHLLDRRTFSNVWLCNGESPSQLVYLNKTEDLFYMFDSSSINLPFVISNSLNCNDLHEQIEYTEDNICHLGITYENADDNYTQEVGYQQMEVGKVYISTFGGFGGFLSRNLPKP